MFKAIGEQTVTVPGTGMAETIIPSIARDIKAIKDRRARSGARSGSSWRTTLFSRSRRRCPG